MRQKQFDKTMQWCMFLYTFWFMYQIVMMVIQKPQSMSEIIGLGINVLMIMIWGGLRSCKLYNCYQVLPTLWILF